MSEPQTPSAGLAGMAQPPSQAQAQGGQDSQSQLQQTPNTQTNGTAPLQSNHGNDFKCLWVGCGESHPSAEVLYDHVCDKHIGRKSTNNLNLQCAWANCSVQVVKRDHITSHIRVHVPLKPHRCGFCGKTFKRPQDLKKHVKTHADDTVLNGMNQNTARDNHQHQNGAFNMGNQTKGHNYYPEHHHMQPHPPMGYAPQGHNGAQNYYGPTQQQGYGNGYGTVSYALGQGGDGNNASFDGSKSIANLNAFVGDVQRGIIDTKSYAQLSNRLMPLQQSGVPYVLSGGMADFQPPPVQVDVGGGQSAAYGSTAQYSLPPLDNLRTKDQLMAMAQRFEQMAATVYEAADQAAAAGVGQPGAHYVSDAMDYRQTLPTPSLQLRSAHNDSPMATTSSRTNHSGSTPVLTPPSSAGSYTAAHSPASTHSNPRLSPATPNGAMYPSLPAPSSAGGYPSSSMAPTATLSTLSENEYRRRHGGGYLQKAQSMGPRLRHQEEVDTSDSASTPKESPMNSPTGPVHRAPMAPMGQVRKAEVLPSNIDPALSGITPESQLKTEDHEAAHEAAQDAEENSVRRDSRWVDTIRTLDILKSYIQHRLANNDFETEGREEPTKREEESETSPSLYPALPQQVEASG